MASSSSSSPSAPVTIPLPVRFVDPNTKESSLKMVNRQFLNLFMLVPQPPRTHVLNQNCSFIDNDVPGLMSAVERFRYRDTLSPEQACKIRHNIYDSPIHFSYLRNFSPEDFSEPMVDENVDADIYYDPHELKASIDARALGYFRYSICSEHAIYLGRILVGVQTENPDGSGSYYYPMLIEFTMGYYFKDEHGEFFPGMRDLKEKGIIPGGLAACYHPNKLAYFVDTNTFHQHIREQEARVLQLEPARSCTDASSTTTTTKAKTTYDFLNSMRLYKKVEDEPATWACGRSDNKRFASLRNVLAIPQKWSTSDAKIDPEFSIEESYLKGLYGKYPLWCTVQSPEGCTLPAELPPSAADSVAPASTAETHTTCDADSMVSVLTSSSGPSSRDDDLLLSAVWGDVSISLEVAAPCPAPAPAPHSEEAVHMCAFLGYSESISPPTLLATALNRSLSSMDMDTDMGEEHQIEPPRITGKKRKTPPVQTDSAGTGPSAKRQKIFSKMLEAEAAADQVLERQPKNITAIVLSDEPPSSTTALFDLPARADAPDVETVDPRKLSLTSGAPAAELPRFDSEAAPLACHPTMSSAAVSSLDNIDPSHSSTLALVNKLIEEAMGKMWDRVNREYVPRADHDKLKDKYRALREDCDRLEEDLTTEKTKREQDFQDVRDDVDKYKEMVVEQGIVVEDIKTTQTQVRTELANATVSRTIADNSITSSYEKTTREYAGVQNELAKVSAHYSSILVQLKPVIEQNKTMRAQLQQVANTTVDNSLVPQPRVVASPPPPNLGAGSMAPLPTQTTSIPV